MREPPTGRWGWIKWAPAEERWQGVCLVLDHTERRAAPLRRSHGDACAGQRRSRLSSHPVREKGEPPQIEESVGGSGLRWSPFHPSNFLINRLKAPLTSSQ